MRRITLLFLLLLVTVTACAEAPVVATYVVEIPTQPGVAETVQPGQLPTQDVSGDSESVSLAGSDAEPTATTPAPDAPAPTRPPLDVTLAVTDLVQATETAPKPATITPTPSSTADVTITPFFTPTLPAQASATPITLPATNTPIPATPSGGGAPTPTVPVQSTQPRVIATTADGVVEAMVEGRTHVVAMAFLPDGRLLFTEKNGRVMLRDTNGTLYTVLSLPTEQDNECGMIGIAVDPNFASNNYLWVYHNVTGQPHTMEVKRFQLVGTTGSDVQLAARWPRLGGVCGHNAGNMHFGTDGYLYITVGDNENPANAQNLTNIPGKIHRFTPTVPLAAAPNGPIANSSIFAYGLRNSFDFAWDPLTGNMWATENGTYCDDEINLMLPGRNYGWRPEANNVCEVSRGLPSDYPYERPIVNWDTSQAPTAILIYTGNQLRFQNELVFCTYTNKWMQRFQFNAARTNFQSWARVEIGNAQCESDATQAPDGSLWFASPSTIYRLRAP